MVKKVAAMLSRGELAKRTDCNIETVRFYERIGVMPEPMRTEGGRRQYTQEHVDRLSFIRRSRELGFSLNEVRDLLRFVDEGDLTCADVKAMTMAHLADVQRKIADLKTLERVLKQIASKCDDDHVPDCPIIEALIARSRSWSVPKPPPLR